jgi:GNAT superfamily N-acetyltransferase
MGPDGDLVEKRLARGCRCFAVEIDGSFAGYGWLSTGPEWIGELQLEIKPKPREGYIWNCVTLPEHRRKGVFRSLITGISAACARDGLRRMWIGTVAIPAEKALGPSGFEPVLEFATVVLAGYIWTRVQPAASADPGTVVDAHQAVAIPAGRFLRTSRARRH